jgi:hemerythrin-like domain-containing protein
MAITQPDIFCNVHKGIRSALFQACTALGRAGDDAVSGAAARDQLRAALHFVEHHGENEDLLLLPLLRERAKLVFERMQRAHTSVNEALRALLANLDSLPMEELYLRASQFLALYLEHLREEEQDIDPVIRAHISVEELSSFGRRAVERTSPSDQRLMLGWMLPAMTAEDVESFLSRVPAESQQEMRKLARRS